MPLLATPDPGTVSKPDQQYWLLPLVLQLSVEVEAAAVEQQPKLFRLSRRTVSSWNVVAMLQNGASLPIQQAFAAAEAEAATGRGGRSGNVN